MAAVSIMDTKLIKTLVKYLRFLVNNNDELLLDIINYPTRGIGPAKVNEIIRLAAENKITRFDACRLIDDKKIQAFVELIEGLRLTMKGLIPGEFINYLISSINYEKIIERESNEKVARIRIETFIEVIKNFLLESDDYLSETFRMLNELFMENTKEKKNENTVKLMTIHQAKGLEAKIVFLVELRRKTFPIIVSSDSNMEAERRLCYVAITRMVEHLIITYSKYFQWDETGHLSFYQKWDYNYTSHQRSQYKKEKQLLLL